MSTHYRHRASYIPNTKIYADYYTGAGLPVFRGVVQDGSGLLGDLFRYALPILKPLAVSAGKNLLRSGTAALSDVVSGERDFKTALKHRGLEALKETGKDVLSKLGGKQETAKKRTKKEIDIFDSTRPRGKRRKKV